MKRSGLDMTRRDLLIVGAASVAASAVPLFAKGQGPAPEAVTISKV